MEGIISWGDEINRQARRKEQRQLREVDLQCIEQQIQTLSPLPLHAVPRPWEDLVSLVCRTARKQGYEHPFWLLQPECISYAIRPTALPLLRRRSDYSLLQRLFRLEEESLYAPTLHRFTDRLHPKQPGDPSLTNLSAALSHDSVLLIRRAASLAGATSSAVSRRQIHTSLSFLPGRGGCI